MRQFSLYVLQLTNYPALKEVEEKIASLKKAIE